MKSVGKLLQAEELCFICLELYPYLSAVGTDLAGP